MDRVNKQSECIIIFYENNGRSKNIKNTKIKPTIYMVILMIVVP